MDKKPGIARIYRKSWPYDNLFGSSRFELTSSNRGVWNDLIDMAKLGRVRPGLISPGPGQAYRHTWLAEFLNVPLEEFEDAIKVLIATKRIKENHTGIEILNWKKYQSEYDRQKPYRQAARSGKRVHKVCPSCGYKAATNEDYCPSCAEKSEEVLLQTDYKGGKYGHMVQQ